MSLRDLQQKLGMNRRGRDLINRAIRAELPGGNECLDALAFFHEMKHRLNETRGEPAAAVCQAAMDRLALVADAMEAEIRRRYAITPPPPSAGMTPARRNEK
jgi:hypothetical protein